MKKILFVLFAISLVWIVQSCVINKLTGTYPEKIYWADSGKSFADSFDNVVELLVDMGYELKSVNRENGIIQINTAMPTKKIWIEKKGKNPPSFVYLVVPESSSVFTTASGLLTVLIRGSEQGSRIGIKLVPYKFGYKGMLDYAGIATTGVFEKEILSALTQSGVMPKK